MANNIPDSKLTTKYNLWPLIMAMPEISNCFRYGKTTVYGKKSLYFLVSTPAKRYSGAKYAKETHRCE
jgi:hypothetical protein